MKKKKRSETRPLSGPEALKAILPEGLQIAEKDLTVLLVVTGLVVLHALGKSGKAPAWVKDLPPLSERRAGPWRGKGSFGRGFGPQGRRRS